MPGCLLEREGVAEELRFGERPAEEGDGHGKPAGGEPGRHLEVGEARVAREVRGRRAGFADAADRRPTGSEHGQERLPGICPKAA